MVERAVLSGAKLGGHPSPHHVEPPIARATTGIGCHLDQTWVWRRLIIRSPGGSVGVWGQLGTLDGLLNLFIGAMKEKVLSLVG